MNWRCLHVISIVCLCLIGGVAYAETDGLIEVASKENLHDGLFVDGPNVLWKAVINGALSRGVAGPLEVKDNSLLFSLEGKPGDEKNGYMCSLNNKEGSVEWVRNIGGMHTSPFITGGVMYVGSYDGYLRAVSVATGKEQWKKKTKNWATAGVYVSPVSDGTNIFFGYDDGILYALKNKTGEESWRLDVGGTLYASPIFLDGLLYFATSAGSLYAVNAATGEKKWERHVESNIFFLNLLIEGDRLVFIWCSREKEDTSSRKIHVSGFARTTGEALWEITRNTAERVGWPIKGYQKIFITIGKEILALDIQTGDVAWRFLSPGVLYPSLFLDGKKIYVANGDPVQYISEAGDEQYLYAFDCDSGDEVWRYKMNGGIRSDIKIVGDRACGYSLGKDESGEERSTVFFVSSNDGHEEGKIMIKKGEKIRTHLLVDAVLYITTKDSDGHSFMYRFDEAI